MKIHFFLKEGMESATARYRGYLMADTMHQFGISSVIYDPVPWSSFYNLSKRRFLDFKNYIMTFYRIPSTDTIYLVRTIYNVDFIVAVLVAVLVFRKKVILDFDDPKFLTFPIRMKVLTRLVSMVVVGSHYLKNWALQYNKSVVLIPTSVPFKTYNSAVSRKEKGLPVIGWIGYGSTHIKNLALAVPVFINLKKAGKQFSVTLIGTKQLPVIVDMFKAVEKEGVSIRYIDDVDWKNPCNIASHIKGFDIGIMPLENSEWNQGKCAFKAIEYMACAVPVVISLVGENKYLVQDGVNGFTARSLEEWVVKLGKLLDDEALRIAIGKVGAEVVEKRYSLESNAAILSELLKSINSSTRFRI